MAYSPQNEAPTWRGMTDVQSFVAGLMALERGAELGVSIPSGDSDPTTPPSDAQGVESDNPAAGDDDGADAGTSEDRSIPDVGQMEAAGEDVPVQEAGDVSAEGDVTPDGVEDDPSGRGDVNIPEPASMRGEVDDPPPPGTSSDEIDQPAGPGEVAGAADEIPEPGLAGDEIDQPAGPGDSVQADDEVPDLLLPDESVDDIAPPAAGEELSENAPAQVDDPAGEGDDPPRAPEVSTAEDDDDSPNLRGGLEFESSTTPEPFRWAPPAGLSDVDVPDNLDLQTEDVSGDSLLSDRQGGY